MSRFIASFNGAHPVFF
ncbi:hypothetical protein CGLO_18066 [Colletotrichum gloeosporioides Cg-14]|uniref:Uncharacterized protein n=1 Tax=Colletotrichum gloeosporioides (strain Cg-14) TaxID=1237896 RepID=T0L4X3_COLGC|nr:hypothetical protein CGLO_18066 [Colletotrichum gloeosporioides Cg-14]